MQRALFGVILICVWTCFRIALAGEITPAAGAELPGNLKPLAEAAGLTPEEVASVATALKEYETGRREVEDRVSVADAAYREAAEKSPVDEGEVIKATAAVKAAKEDRKRYYQEKAVDIATLIPAEKYSTWVSTDLERTVLRSLSAESVKLDSDQLKALGELCKAHAAKQIAAKNVGTKAGRKELLAEVREKILTVEQRSVPAPAAATDPATTAPSQRTEP